MRSMVGLSYLRSKGIAVAILAGVLTLNSMGSQAIAQAKSKPAATKKAVVSSKAVARKPVTAVRPEARRTTSSSTLATVKPSTSYKSSLAGQGVRLDLPRLESQAVYVTDIETGLPLLAKNGMERRPIASITKIMTAMVVLDKKLNLNESITVTNADVDRVKFSSSRLPVGTRMTRGDMIHIALMSSENRAAHALGRTYPGGMPAFVKAMNAKAKALGLKNTKFTDPTGLGAGNVASPRDLAHLVAAAAKYKTIRQYSTDAEDVIQMSRNKRVFRNTNPLVRNSNWSINVSKTGYIQEAGRCLVMQVVINSRPTLIVLMNSQSNQARVRDAAAVKRWLEQKETQSTLKAADLMLSEAPSGSATATES